MNEHVELLQQYELTKVEFNKVVKQAINALKVDIGKSRMLIQEAQDLQKLLRAMRANLYVVNKRLQH